MGGAAHEGDNHRRMAGGTAMSDTPRTDAAYFEQGATMYSMAGEMKRLERELAASIRDRDAAYRQYKDDVAFHQASVLHEQRKLAAAMAQRDRLADALDTLSLVVGLTPIAGNKEAIQEANNLARQALAELKGPTK